MARLRLLLCLAVGLAAAAILTPTASFSQTFASDPVDQGVGASGGDLLQCGDVDPGYFDVAAVSVTCDGARTVLSGGMSTHAGRLTLRGHSAWRCEVVERRAGGAQYRCASGSRLLGFFAAA